ncbi:unnamed protein product [Heligmosomoides polygyrus]|uniref:UL11 n=1 Tax=Heligmosomoides polygyrus TaxID=6339 RepID=A0A183G0Z0_HELPZ|nr:unnamed protein product [Heligmosomoides polygyrus]
MLCMTSLTRRVNPKPLRDIGDTSSEPRHLMDDVGDMSSQAGRALRDIGDTSSESGRPFATLVTPTLNPGI